jgi:uncharacterized Zn finger protein
MFQETALNCPICGNSGVFVHTYMTKPTFGSCEKCGLLGGGNGVYPRTGMDHRRPKTIPDWEYYR